MRFLLRPFLPQRPGPCFAPLPSHCAPGQEAGCQKGSQVINLKVMICLTSFLVENE